MTTGIIYRATNNITGKCYIGQTTKTLEFRRKKHYVSATTYGRGGYRCHFYDAIRKYGTGVWTWEILAENIPACRLGLEEMLAVYLYDSYYEGYNSTLGGDKGTLGRKCSEETRKKISIAHKGKKLTDEQRKECSIRLSGAGNPRYGKHCSEETKSKISAAVIGKPSPMLGKHQSEKTKKLLSEAKAGKPNLKHSEQMRGVGNPNYGKITSDEVKEKIRKANAGKHRSEETKRKMSEAAKNRGKKGGGSNGDI